MNFKNCLLLIGIFFIALFLRTYHLSSIPYGFHVDEVKAAWNALSIYKTGHDDKGNFLPMYYDSFGDFRPTGLFYAIIPSLILFGQTIFAVRFPVALIGALSIFPLFFIVKELSKKSINIGIVAALILSLNPWHIIASRSTSESIISIFFTLWGLYFLIKSLKKCGWKNVLLSIISFVLSYFFYHSIRVLAPAFVLITITLTLFLKKGKQINYWPFIIFIVLVITSVVFMSSKEARGRMSQVSLKSDFNVLYEVTKMPNEEGPGHVFEARAFHNRIASYMRRFVEEYKEYFGTSFLLGNIAKPIRYTVPYVGLLTYFEFIFVIIGLFWVSKRKELLIILALLVLSPIPAAVTIEDTPNIQRAINMIPFLVILAAYGLVELSRVIPKWLTKFIVFGFIVNFIYFFHMYFIHEKMSIASYYRNGGNVELVTKLEEIKSNYSKIILTNSPDSLLPWIAFLGNYDPKIVNSKIASQKNSDTKTLDNFIFSNDKCPSERLQKSTEKIQPNLLIVDAEGCEINPILSKTKKINTIEVIKRPDGSPPYYLRTISEVDDKFFDRTK